MIQLVELYQLFLQSTGVSTDTRAIKNGSVFFALKGASFNGNRFALQALELGARFAVVDEPELALDERFLVVEDVLLVLQDLAAYHRKQLGIPIIGITGTNGKTTTKELVNEVLAKKYKVFVTQGNFNNHLGVPLTLLLMDKDTEVGIVEMGANHEGEIELLCEIADPDYGLITNVGKAHLEGFGSFEGVMKTKAELYRYIETKNGTLFINGDNEYLISMLQEGAALYRYGKSDGFKVVFKEFVKEGSFLSFSARVKGVEVEFRSNLVGNYNLENAMAAIAVGTFLEVDVEDICSAIAAYIPTNNRSQLLVTDKNKVIFDAYNANPTSMQAALLNFAVQPEKGKIVILGEMKELGAESDREHKEIISFLKENYSIKAILVGGSYKDFVDDSDYSHFETVDLLIEDLIKCPIVNSFVLVKGSRANKLERLRDVL